MPTLGRRLQILLDDERYERLRLRAEDAGTSVAAVVRDAIDRDLPRADPERARAIDALIDLPPMPIDDWEVIEEELLDSYERTAVDDRDRRRRA